MVRTRLPVMRGIAFIVAVIFSCGTAVAEPDQTSADHIMPACRDAAALITFTNSESKENLSRISFCIGIITGLSYMGQPYGICLPVGATSQKAARVVVQYIDGQSPERMNENFMLLAVEALQAAWPCKNLARRD